MDSLTVLEAVSPIPVSLDQNQGISRATFPLEALAENRSLPLPASGVCQHS